MPPLFPLKEISPVLRLTRSGRLLQTTHMRMQSFSCSGSDKPLAVSKAASIDHPCWSCWHRHSSATREAADGRLMPRGMQPI